MPMLEVTNVKKTYTARIGAAKVETLKNVTFTAEKGEYIAIMGESGSGKTTLLNILAALDKPTGGKVVLDGAELSKVKEREAAKFRRDNLGFVFQEFMTRSILTLASYDKELKNSSLENNIRQCLQLISQFPTLAVYSYNAYNYYQNFGSMYIHYPDTKLSPAENILTMLRPDKKYTKTEAKVLDTALILHMEHGGGNNSTFTTRVVTSSGSDTYSTIAAAMCSLKGPKHGGANIKVMDMMADISAQINDIEDDEEITAYLEKILDKETFDRKGLIYGMGHAVYTLSDPREKVLKSYVKQLAAEKCRTKEFRLYEQVERLAPQIIMNRKHNSVCPNVDFYSGFVYDMLGIPKELYTAIFAVARIVGWSAHRIEEIVCTDKIIRPAYMSVMRKKDGQK